MKNKVISMIGNNKVIQNEGVKYSELFEKFMTPFQNDFVNSEYIEDVLDFAVSAWNFGNMKVIVPNDEFDKIIATAPRQEVDLRLLKKMIDYKVKKFKKYTNFIVDCEVEETIGDPILRVITQNETDFLSNMMDGEGDQITEDDFEENYINRNAIVIKPLQPFFDWQNNLYPDGEMDETWESNIYLVTDEIDDLETWLKKKFDKFL